MISAAKYPDMTSALEIQWLDAFSSDVELQNVKQLYKVESTDNLDGYISSLDGFSPARVKEEGDDLPYLSLTQNYRKAWTTYVIGGMEKITWELRKGDKYGEITDRIRGMAKSAAERMMYDLTHRFTYAASTTYTDADGRSVSITGGDGFQWAYSAHTVNGASTTYRNIVSGNPVLSKTGLEAAEVLFMTQMIDENGNPKPRKASHLVVFGDSNTVNTALEYLNSTAAPDTSNSGVFNTYKGRYQLVQLAYGAMAVSGTGYAYSSTYAKYWALMDLTNKRNIVKVLQEPMMIDQNTPGARDFETMDWKFGNFGSYAIVTLDGKGAIFSKGDGTA